MGYIGSLKQEKFITTAVLDCLYIIIHYMYLTNGGKNLCHKNIQQSTIYAIVYNLCHSLQFMPKSTIFAIVYNLCYSLQFMPQSAIYVIVYNLCHSLQFMPQSTIYAIVYNLCYSLNLCHSVQFMPQSTIYDIVYNLCHSLQFMPQCAIYTIVYNLCYSLQFMPQSTIYAIVCNLCHSLQFMPQSTIYAIVYNCGTKIFTGMAKPIRIIGDPDYQRPDKWSYTVIVTCIKKAVLRNTVTQRQGRNLWSFCYHLNCSLLCCDTNPMYTLQSLH